MPVFQTSISNPGANTQSKVWIKTDTRAGAKRWVRNHYSDRHAVAWCLERTPPEGVSIVEVDA